MQLLGILLGRGFKWYNRKTKRFIFSSSVKSANWGFVRPAREMIRNVFCESYHLISQNAVVKVGVGLEVLCNKKNYLLLL